MRKQRYTLTLAAALGMALGAQAAVLTVSNNVNSPGQYTNLQEAIDASSPTDTILVHGSATSYGSVDLNWPLTLIGAGYNNPYGENTKVSQIDLRRANASVGSSGARIIGFEISQLNFSPGFSGGNNQNQVLTDILVERCVLSTIIFSNSSSFNNIRVRNCVIEGSGFQLNGQASTGYTFYNNVRIENNIFTDGGRKFYAFGSNTSGVVVSNNVFLNGNSALFTFFGTMTLPQMVMENNIFYGVWPEGCELCSFNNNITFSCNNDNLVYSGNPGSVGSGNIIGENPRFVSYPVLGGAFSYTHNYRLQAASPGIGAGTDGTDIGIYGGSSPFVDPGTNPNVPQMMFVEFQGPSSVGVGGTLNVQFRSHRQD